MNSINCNHNRDLQASSQTGIGGDAQLGAPPIPVGIGVTEPLATASTTASGPTDSFPAAGEKSDGALRSDSGTLLSERILRLQSRLEQVQRRFSTSPFMARVESRWNRVLQMPPIRQIHRSLMLRLTLIIIVTILVTLLILSVFVTTHVRDGVFERHLEQVIADASLRTQSVQSQFDQATAESLGSLQDTAYTLMSESRDAIAGAGGVGVMLIRDTNEVSGLSINTIIDEDLQPLLSKELRERVQSSEGLHWQSVALKNENGSDIPAIIVGSRLNLPVVGSYEFYLVYSLQTEQVNIEMINQVLFVGTGVMMVLLVSIILLVTYSSLRPVRQVAQAAERLSEGHLGERLPVHGNDEIAQLQRSFNDMSASLEQQFHSYRELALLQQRFVSDVSHGLRTPLSTIRIAADLLYDQREVLSPMMERSATLLHRQVDQFDKMLADLIEISRIDAQTAQLRAEKIDLVEVVSEVVENSQTLADKLGVVVNLQAPDKLVAEIDRIRITRIVRNLLTNAIEYADGKPVDVTVAASKTAAAVQVRDHGQGMNDSVAQHVFDRFYRADPSRKRTTGGTGLGLAISAEDAALHKGFLTVLSCPNYGSAFLLLVPLRQDQEIREVPSEVDTQDLVQAREKWRQDHPQDITLSQFFDQDESPLPTVELSEDQPAQLSPPAETEREGGREDAVQ